MDGNLIKTGKFEKRRDIIQIIISVFSTVIVLLTLFEMQAQRNAAYRPDITLSNTEVAIVRDKNGFFIDNGEKFEIISKFKNDKTKINSIPKIKVSNLGVGNTKNVQIIWNQEDNINKLSSIFKQIENISVSYNNGTVEINKNNEPMSITESDKINFDYVSNTNENEDENKIALPMVYFYLINELFMNEQSENIPDLFVDLIYSDIQGKTYSKSIKLSVTPSFGTINSDGSGGYVYNIMAERENISMNLLGFINIGSDDLVATTSVFAVLVSIISIIFTVIFSIQQIKHNKNSVRPIAAIQCSDYENLISVSIRNVGTGPLTVDKLICKYKNNIEESTLIDLLHLIIPNINQNWDDYVENIDGWGP